MTEITYVKGDATVPQGKGPKIIAHICNDIGRWGKGFVLAISARWTTPEEEYKGWRSAGDGFELGAVQLVQVERLIYVANMIGQRGIKRGSLGPPIRYEAVAACLEKLTTMAVELKATVHMPRIGCGLAGGEWSEIEPLILATLSAADVPVTVYDYDG